MRVNFRNFKRKFLIGAAAAAAGGLIVYYWWGDKKTQETEQREAEKRLEQLDKPIESHFNFIQSDSTPQEVKQLLPKVHEILNKQTDISLIRQTPQAIPPVPGLPTLPSAQLSSAEKLHRLAQQCFSRVIAACYLVPLSCLLTQAKLNVIGRHLFLQEKLGKLFRPASFMEQQQLPPRLSPSTVEAFLQSEGFLRTGCSFIISKAQAASESVLTDVSMSRSVTPDDIFGFLRSMLVQMEELLHVSIATASSSSSSASPAAASSVSWIDILMDDYEFEQQMASAAATAAAGGRPDVNPSSAAMLMQRAGLSDLPPLGMSGALGSCPIPVHLQVISELRAELHAVLRSTTFQEALSMAVDVCVRVVMTQIKISLTSIPVLTSAPVLSTPPPPRTGPIRGRSTLSGGGCDRAVFCGCPGNR